MTSDRAGNNFRSARPILLNSQTHRYRDWLDRKDRQDLYRFRLNQASNVTLSLKPEKAKLLLLNQSGRVIQKLRRSNRVESIAQMLDSGIYYLKVSLGPGKVNRSSVRYTLQAAATTDQSATPLSLLPDLRGFTFTTNSDLTPGGLLRVNFGLQNDGLEGSAGTKVAFYLSGDRQITTGDRLLGSYDLGPIASNSATGVLSQSFTLPDRSGNFFWQGDGDYYVGMIVDSSNLNIEANETNNSNIGSGLDSSTLRVQQTSIARSFNIQFDYRFDTQGWFTVERRSALEAAANIWETILQDEFPDVAAGTEIFTRNPQPVRTTTTSTTVTQEYENQIIQLDAPIDDLLVFVGSGNLGNAVLGLGGASLTTAGNFGDRWQGNDFEPWIGSVTFNSTANWFFDATPSTADDLPANQYDFISVAVHELGHILGFATNAAAFSQQLQNQAFYGPNAMAQNGNLPIPMEADGQHIQTNYQFGQSGMPLMNPLNPIGTRLLPTVLDLAILDDIGYTVNYNAASQNLV